VPSTVSRTIYSKSKKSSEGKKPNVDEDPSTHRSYFRKVTLQYIGLH
jgi:hypothetical protein